MPITKSQARRALRHADIPWDARVDDPREISWVVHAHKGILGGLAAAFAVGCWNLRRAEDFFTDLGLGARRALGLGRETPCDTTFYRVLEEQSPVGFQETVFAQVKECIVRKVVKNDRFRVGVMTFDGKGTWSRTGGDEVNGARHALSDVGSAQTTKRGIRSAVVGWNSLRRAACAWSFGAPGSDIPRYASVPSLASAGRPAFRD